MARTILSFVVAVSAVSSICNACIMTPPPTPVHLSTSSQARVVHDGDRMHVEYTFPEEPSRFSLWFDARAAHGSLAEEGQCRRARVSRSRPAYYEISKAP